MSSFQESDRTLVTLEESLISLYDGVMPCDPPLEKRQGQVYEADVVEDWDETSASRLNASVAAEVKRYGLAKYVNFA